MIHQQVPMIGSGDAESGDADSSALWLFRKQAHVQDAIGIAATYAGESLSTSSQSKSKSQKQTKSRWKRDNSKRESKSKSQSRTWSEQKHDRRTRKDHGPCGLCGRWSSHDENQILLGLFDECDSHSVAECEEAIRNTSWVQWGWSTGSTWNHKSWSTECVLRSWNPSLATLLAFGHHLRNERPVDHGQEDSQEVVHLQTSDSGICDINDRTCSFHYLCMRLYFLFHWWLGTEW